MNSWDKNRKETMYKQKLQRVKSTMHKRNNTTVKKKNINSVNINSPQAQNKIQFQSPLSIHGTSYNNNMLIVESAAGINTQSNYIDQLCILSSNNDFDINTQITRQENFQKQKNLKRFLKEFGLQQYLRKFYELGYDDTNIYKLSKIPYKEYEEFLILVKAFPGHKVKIISFIEYIKKIYSAPSNNNVKSNQINHSSKTKTSFYLTNNLQKTSQSAATKRFHSVTTRVSNPSKLPAKPKSVESLLSKNKILRSLAKTNGNNYGFGFDYYLSEDENNKNDMKNLNDDLDNMETKSKDEHSNNINNQIDKMLNFYMSKLNEDIEDSYESNDDNICLSDYQSNCIDEPVSDMNNNGNIENKNMNISVIKIKDEAEDTPIYDVKTQIEMIDKSACGIVIKEELNTVMEAKIKRSPSDDFDIDYSNLLDQSLDDEKGDLPKEEIECINLKQNIEEKPNQVIFEKQITNEEKEEKYVIEIASKVHNSDFNEQSQPVIKVKGRLTKSSDNNTNSEEITDPYGHIRLTKSCEKEYLREDMDNFDIEYMCRCLGLALMKHLESGQDKSHIMELIDFSQNFSFFNSLFNSNMDFFFTFFNMENQDKLSNLDKLTLDEYTQSKANKANSDVNLENANESKPISFFSHIQPNIAREHMIKDEEDKSLLKNENLTNSKNETVSLQKDIKIINEFFKTQPVSDLSNYNHILNDRYKNINEKTKTILNQDLNPINELDSLDYCKKNLLLTVEHQKDLPLKSKDVNYANLLKRSAAEFIGLENQEDDNISSNENDTNVVLQTENRFSNYNIAENLCDDLDKIKKDSNNQETEDIDDYYYKDTPLLKIREEIFEKDEPEFESGLIESNYIFDVTNAEKLKNFLLKTVEVYDDDYNYAQAKITHKRYAPMPDPNQIFEFCTNVIITTKMEKEVIIICLIYIERFIFNTGILINSRNWRRILFTSLIIASKIWDDDSFENNHFSQVFTHLSIGEINMMERSFLELINYKVYVKCSEYFKYFFIIKSIALKYNFDGLNLVPISVERMMVLQEYAYQMQKRLRRKYSYSNSAQF